MYFLHNFNGFFVDVCMHVCMYIYVCIQICISIQVCMYMQLVLLYAHELSFFTFFFFYFFHFLRFCFLFLCFRFLFANVAAAHHDEHFFIQADNYI